MDIAGTCLSLARHLTAWHFLSSFFEIIEELLPLQGSITSNYLMKPYIPIDKIIFYE
jgi:hypothetical protein